MGDIHKTKTDDLYIRWYFALSSMNKVFSKFWIPVASFTKQVNLQLAKRPLIINGRLANRGLTTLVKEVTGIC